MTSTKLDTHPHPMIFSEFPPSTLSFCAACRDLIRGASYDCETCADQFHKECVEIPLVLRHPFHLTHPLSLFIGDTGGACRFCAKSSPRLFYKCSLCNTDSCVKCAVVKPPARVIPSPIHEHPFTALARPISFVCDACGEIGDFDPFICNLCDLMLHERCISLLPTLRISRHIHPVSHTFYLRDPSLSCQICQRKMNPKFGAYRCSSCDYVAHVKCAKESRLLSRGSLTEGEEVGAEGFGGEGRRLKHLGHPQHDLTLVEYYKDTKDIKLCRGCVLPISEPMYGCASCDFFLHKKCARLPERIQHVLHNEHPLLLQPTCTKRISFRGIFQCNACYELCNGFCYSCCEDNCDFTLDVRCGSVPQPFEHPNHAHPLFCLFSSKTKCDACGHEDLPLLSCISSGCNFALDFLCATLPAKVVHKYDEHVLSICFGDYQNSCPGTYWCEICELEIDRKHSFYVCNVCGFTPHIGCILPSHPFVRQGGTIRHEAHPHPLILTENKAGEASCFFRGRKYCDDGLLFKCPDPTCGFAGCIFCLFSQEQSIAL